MSSESVQFSFISIKKPFERVDLRASSVNLRCHSAAAELCYILFRYFAIRGMSLLLSRPLG
jgi:hypothetical protein